MTKTKKEEIQFPLSPAESTRRYRARPEGIRVGDKFDPKNCGFYVPEVVGQDKSLRLTEGQKRLYWRAVTWSGNGTFWRKYKLIAQALGRSVRQVKRDMQTLEHVGLMGHDRRYRKPNSYYFLWHDIFDLIHIYAADRTSGVILAGQSVIHHTKEPIHTVRFDADSLRDLAWHGYCIVMSMDDGLTLSMTTRKATADLIPGCVHVTSLQGTLPVCSADNPRAIRLAEFWPEFISPLVVQ